MRRTIALIPLLLAPTGCESARSSKASLPPSPYIATAIGRVDSAEEARHLVAAADGVIARVHVERGEQVTAGQPLLSVDCAPRIAAASARSADADRITLAERVLDRATTTDANIATAEVIAATATLRNEEQRHARALALRERGFLSVADLDARVQALASARAALSSAEARRADLSHGARPAQRAEARAAVRVAREDARTARAQGEQCTLRSPIAGTILQVMRREGEFSGASQGTPLIMVGDLTRRIVRAEITERDAALLHDGQAADVWIEGRRPKWRGTIDHAASVMGRRTARSFDPTDRFDRDVREAFIRFEGEAPPALVGLRVMVGVRP